jgi:hypothetical protein
VWLLRGSAEFALFWIYLKEGFFLFAKKNKKRDGKRAWGAIPRATGKVSGYTFCQSPKSFVDRPYKQEERQGFHSTIPL